VPGIAGIARVASGAHPDESQFDRKSEYYDPKSKRDDPRWMLVGVKLVKRTRLMPLDEMRGYPELARMVTLKRGNRLSITPVTEGEWKFILGKLGA
jgi:predicted RNA-binding protein with PUA-like domain